MEGLSFSDEPTWAIDDVRLVIHDFMHGPRSEGIPAPEGRAREETIAPRVRVIERAAVTQFTLPGGHRHGPRKETAQPTRDSDLGAHRQPRRRGHYAAATAVQREVRLPDGWRLHLPERHRQRKLRRWRRMQERFGDE